VLDALKTTPVAEYLSVLMGGSSERFDRCKPRPATACRSTSSITRYFKCAGVYGGCGADYLDI
jgi:hypothetical protein